MWLFVLYLLIWIGNVQMTVFNSFSDDESNVIVVPFFDHRYPEVISQFRFVVTDTNLVEQCESFCNQYSLSRETCNKILWEADGRLVQWWKYELSKHQSTKYYYEYKVSSPAEHQSYPLLKTNFCFVTAFYDLGRGGEDWKNFQRSTQKYLLYFSKMVQLNIPLIVFIDDRYYSDLTKLINQYNYRQTHILLIPINESFLEQNIQSWQYLSTDEAIMRSSQYKATLVNRPRPDTPETIHPQYTCFTHSKIDYLMYVLNNQIALTSGEGDSEEVRSVDYLGWIDFGYIRHNYAIVPFELNEELLMGSKNSNDGVSSNKELDYITVGEVTGSDDPLSVSGTVGSDGSNTVNTVPQHHRMHVMQAQPLTPEDGDPLHTVSHAPDRIMGGFMFGHTSVIVKYADLYHRSVSELHSRGIADDEQAIMAYLYWKEPVGSLFKLWRNQNMIEGVREEEWLGAFVMHLFFNKRTVRRKDVRTFIEANRD